MLAVSSYPAAITDDVIHPAHMTPVTIDGYLSKKEIEAAYGRSFRSLTRDISRAVRASDANVLCHLKLVTEDNRIREGTEVTLAMVQELSNNGLRPMWLAEEAWVARWCAERSKRASSSDEPPEHLPQPPLIQQPSPPDLSAKNSAQLPAIELLQHRVNDQQQQIAMLRGELQIKNEQIRTANQLAQQNQELMRNLQVLLKNVQDGLLGEGTRMLRTRSTTKPTPHERPPQTIVEAPPSTADQLPRRTAKPTRRKRAPAAKRPLPKKPAQKVAGRLERWFPTLLRPKRKGD
jgi:hypothetical protein